MEPMEDSSSETASAKDELKELIQTLEQHTSWDGRSMHKFEGFWYPTRVLQSILSSRKNFEANDTDILLASMPKSGTTWLMALTFAIAKRNVYSIDRSPLLASNPHELVQSLEYVLYWDRENPDLQHLAYPRIFSTHVPFNVLPDSTLASACKIVYICRNPLDQFISHRQYVLKNARAVNELFYGKSKRDIHVDKELDAAGIDESFDMFCKGIYPFGPIWEHVMGYWNAHLKNPKKILFLRYEDLKDDIVSNIRKIAEFLGVPFSLEEEKDGLIEQISSLCSFEKLSALEVNKIGVTSKVKNSTYFRKGQIGDWRNYLTPAMAERINKVMETKFEGSGLSFVALK